MYKILDAQHISLMRNENKILSNINFSVNKSEIIAIIGPNGSGKTSLLKIITGIIKDYKGQLNMDQNARIAYMPQQFEFSKSLRITVNEFLKLNVNAAPYCLNEAIELVGIQNKLKCNLHHLSGGELQKVLLANCIAFNPELMILDEPSSNMDINTQVQFYEIILKIRKKIQCSIVMSSHNLYMVMQNTDRIICLNTSICCEGLPQDIACDNNFIELFGKNFAIYQHKH